LKRPLPQPSAQDLALLDPDGRFRDRLEADRQALAQLSDAGDLDKLRRVVHGLAGAAGTFGYGDIGDIAIEFDDRFRSGAPPVAVDIARLLAALEQALGTPEKSV
jgi:HPt (histidine-containing phosphotransfer) domain-containing protein